MEKYSSEVANKSKLLGTARAAVRRDFSSPSPTRPHPSPALASQFSLARSCAPQSRLQTTSRKPNMFENKGVGPTAGRQGSKSGSRPCQHRRIISQRSGTLPHSFQLLTANKAFSAVARHFSRGGSSDEGGGEYNFEITCICINLAPEQVRYEHDMSMYAYIARRQLSSVAEPSELVGNGA